jgi:hypothetical protein
MRIEIATKLAGGDKGLLAMEESNATFDKQFAAPPSDHTTPRDVSSEMELQELALSGIHLAFVLSRVPYLFVRPM